LNFKTLISSHDEATYGGLQVSSGADRLYGDTPEGEHV